jgi:hypothetical protein
MAVVHDRRWTAPLRLSQTETLRGRRAAQAFIQDLMGRLEGVNKQINGD